ATARDWRAIIDVLREAGAGLAAAHAAGLVHRDFKPDNVLVQTTSGEPRVLVIDFGVARAIDETELEARQSGARMDVGLTATGALVGTPAYMAPEQLQAGTIDARTDIFAFAATTWEALYGVRAYRGASIPAIVAAMAEPLAPPPRGSGARRIPRW